MKSKRVPVIMTLAGIFGAGLAAVSAHAQSNTQPPRDQQNTNSTRPEDQQNRDTMQPRSDRSDFNRDHETMPPQSAAEVKRLLDQAKKSIPELIQTAESRTGGKACSAAIMEWRCVSDAVRQSRSNINPSGLTTPRTTGNNDSDINTPGATGNRTNINNMNIDVTADDINKKSPSDPVAVIACVDNSKVTEVLLCANTGKVISTAQCPQFAMGKSNFVCMKGDSFGGSDFGSRWNAAPRRWQKVTDLMKKPVHSQQGNEQIGDVKDLVIDPDGGRVLFTVIEFSDKMGHGDRWFAVPLSVAKLSEDYKSVAMDYSTAEVNQANGFDSNNWPNIGNESWASQIYRAYGERPYWKSHRRDGQGRISKATATDENRGRTITASDRRNPYENQGRGMNYPSRWQKASDLVGKTVRNPSTNEDLGKLNDIVIDPDTGRILYGVLSFGGFLGLGDKLFAIPWNSLELASDYKTVNLSVDKERLKNAEGFDEQNWPDMANPQWASKTYDFYGEPRYWETDRRDNTDGSYRD